MVPFLRIVNFIVVDPTMPWFWSHDRRIIVTICSMYSLQQKSETSSVTEDAGLLLPALLNPKPSDTCIDLGSPFTRNLARAHVLCRRFGGRLFWFGLLARTDFRIRKAHRRLLRRGRWRYRLHRFLWCCWGLHGLTTDLRLATGFGTWCSAQTDGHDLPRRVDTRPSHEYCDCGQRDVRAN